MGAESIEFEFNRAISQADRLEEIANELKTVSKSDVESTLSDLRSGWRGDSALMYIDKGEVLAEKILKISDDLTRSAKSIRKIAKRLYDAEMMALEIATARKY